MPLQSCSESVQSFVIKLPNKVNKSESLCEGLVFAPTAPSSAFETVERGGGTVCIMHYRK